MKLFDSHCHLDDRQYENDLDDVLTRARSAGVKRMMTIGIDKESSRRAVYLAKNRPDVFASVGVHPHDAKDCSEPVLDYLKILSKSPIVKAWGEIGLDFNRMYSPRKDQEKWFVRQIEIAGELHLPLIFHERETNGRFFEMITTCGVAGKKAVVHCFSGTGSELGRYISLGLYIGITGLITIKGRGATLRTLAPLIPIDRLLVETDAPYLTPVPQKNQIRRNEPAFVRSVLLKLAEVRKEDPEYLADRIWQNSCRLFNLDP